MIFYFMYLFSQPRPSCRFSIGLLPSFSFQLPVILSNKGVTNLFFLMGT